MDKVRQENIDFAAELTRYKSLLKLQTDIEKENRQYFEQEKERLKLLESSTALKARELAKKTDDQDKFIKSMRQKLGLTRRTERSASPSAIRTDGLSGPYPDVDVLSDFSIAS